MIQPQTEVLDMTVVNTIDAIEDDNWRVYKAALMYCDLGFYLLPIVRNGKAIPQKKYQVAYAHATRKRKVIERWFHPTDGKFAGWNLGIATGRTGGTFVMDVDMHGDVDGFVTLRQLLEDYDEHLPLGPIQTTPNGGKHFLYYWQEDAVSSTGKIGSGIDTRGGTDVACKGHIVVWPSTVDGKRYEWETGGPIPSIPIWMMERLGVSWSSRPARGTGRGNENIGDDDIEQQVPLEQVVRMLGSINPNDMSYDEWLQIGMAIRSQHPGEDGLAAWDEWSSHGDRYDDKECLVRWEGFSEMGAVRMATLFWFAQKAGHVAKPTDKKANPFAVAVERMNDSYAIVVVGNKIRIIKEVETTVSDKMATPYHLLSRSDFLTLTENDRMLVDPEKGKYMPTGLVWLGDDSRRTYQNGLGLFPEGEPEGYYNTWKGFACEPIPGECAMFYSHILDVVCGGNADMYEYVLDWCADLFQNPGDPKGVAVVMRGTEGTGKGTFANTIGMMCAPHYTHLIDENHLTGQFNGHLSDSIVVFADEITWGGNVKSAGKLKGLVTERHMLLERKGVDAVIQRNLTHMLVASNSEWVMPAGMESRRWLVLDVSPKMRSNVKYFTELNVELDTGGREAFLHDMLEREITSNLTEAPVTAALVEQRTIGAMAEDTVLRWWTHVLLNNSLPCEDIGNPSNTGWPTYVLKGELYALYEDYCLTRRIRAKANNVFFKAMLAYGFSGHKKVAHHGKRIRVATVPEFDDAVKLIERLTGIKQETI